MPLIVLQNVHGENDAPLHIALLEALERRGVLDAYDFVVDPTLDLTYCSMLVDRFPQVQLHLPEGLMNRSVRRLSEITGRGVRFAAHFSAASDAVCQSAGGGIHPDYSNSKSLFWRFPNAKRRAILFHSIEQGVIGQRDTAQSIASCDLIITRTVRSSEVAIAVGAAQRAVHVSSDIVFSRPESNPRTVPGLATALRVDKAIGNDAYLSEIVKILNYFEQLNIPIDQTPIEKPLGQEQLTRGYHKGDHPLIKLWNKQSIYEPFETRRQAVISSRLHTTLLALMAGNLKILQFQIEPNTTKITDILADIGLGSFPVLSKADVSVDTIKDFLEGPENLDQNEVSAALAKARALNEAALDRMEEWLMTLR